MTTGTKSASRSVGKSASTRKRAPAKPKAAPAPATYPETVTMTVQEMNRLVAEQVADALAAAQPAPAPEPEPDPLPVDMTPGEEAVPREAGFTPVVYYNGYFPNLTISPSPNTWYRWENGKMTVKSARQEAEVRAYLTRRRIDPDRWRGDDSPQTLECKECHAAYRNVTAYNDHLQKSKHMLGGD